MRAFSSPSRRALLACIVPLALMGGCASGGRAKEAVNLSGHWQRDDDASDDARAILSDAFASAKGHAGGGGKRGMQGGMGGGGMGGMGGGMGGGRGGMGGGRHGMGGGGQGAQGASGGSSRPNTEQMHKQLDQFVLPPEKLDVEQSPQDVHMVYDTDRETRTLTPGQKSSITFMDDRGSAEVEPAWKGTTLTVHTSIANRLTVDEEYALSKDGELVATEKLAGGAIKSVTIKSVYKRVQ